MEYLKFEGVLKKIQENYSKNFDIVKFLCKELNISEHKAKLLAERIVKLIDFETVILINHKVSDEQIVK